MNQKILWFDTETTGLDHQKNDIIQFAAIVEIDKKVVDEIQLKLQPVSYENISQEALNVHGYGIDKLKTFMDYQQAYREINNFLSKYIDRYDKTDKFLSAGQNVRFDIDFLRSFFIKNGDNYFGSFFDYHFLDLQAITAIMIRNDLLNTKTYKLVDVAEAIGFSFNAHDALEDIKMTRKIYLEMEKKLLGANKWKS